MITMLKNLPLKQLLLSLAAVLCGSYAFGQTYEQAQSKYQMGDLEGAQKAVNLALKKQNSIKSQAKMLKLKGIIVYTKGNHNGAERLFKESLSLDKTVNIDTQEVLDPSVIPFFKKIKGRAMASQTVQATQPSENLGQAKVQRAPKVTFLRVRTQPALSPPPKVMVDGIYAGEADSTLNVESGKVLVEVTSPGYLPSRTQMAIIAGIQNELTVQLQKQQTNPAALVAVPATGRPVAPMATHKNFKNPPVSKDQAADLFEEKPTSAPLRSSNGFYVQTERAPQTDFDREIAAAQKAERDQKIYASQQRMAQAQRQQQAQRVRANSQYQVQSVATTQPESVRDYDTQPLQTQQQIPDPALAHPAQEKSKPYTFLTVLPFGIGQLSEQRYLEASILFIAQAGALYFYIDRESISNKVENQLASYVDKNCVSDLAATDQRFRDCQKYVDSQYKYIDGLRQEGRYGLAIFGVLALGGIVDAMMWDPPPVARKKKPRNRRYAEDTVEPEYHYSFTPILSPKKELSFGLSLDTKF